MPNDELQEFLYSKNNCLTGRRSRPYSLPGQPAWFGSAPAGARCPATRGKEAPFVNRPEVCQPAADPGGSIRSPDHTTKGVRRGCSVPAPATYLNMPFLPGFSRINVPIPRPDGHSPCQPLSRVLCLCPASAAVDFLPTSPLSLNCPTWRPPRPLWGHRGRPISTPTFPLTVEAYHISISPTYAGSGQPGPQL